MIIREGPMRTRLQMLVKDKCTLMTVSTIISIRFGSPSTANSVSYTLEQIFSASTSAIRLSFGPSRIIVVQNTPTRVSFRFLYRVCFFITVPANRRACATKSRRTKDRRSEGKIWAKSERQDLDTFLKNGTSSIHARTTGKNTKEHYRRTMQGRRRTIDRRRR